MTMLANQLVRVCMRFLVHIPGVDEGVELEGGKRVWVCLT